MFDVRRLLVLQEVARCGSLSGAAATMNYTTSAVSQQIAALERDVGCTLVMRGPSGAKLTSAGVSLLAHAPHILAAIAAAERELGRLTSGVGALRIASFASAASGILPLALARLRAASPNSDLELVGADPDDGVAMLRAGDVDAAIITEVPGERAEYPDVFTVPVYDDEFYVVLPASHQLATSADVALAKLADEKWVVSSATGTCPDTRVFTAACRRAGFVPSVTFRADDYSTVQGMVAAGLGVSLVPSLAAAGARSDVALCRILGERPSRRISIATAAAPAKGGILAALVGFVQSAGRQVASDGVYSVPARTFSVA